MDNTQSIGDAVGSTVLGCNVNGSNVTIYNITVNVAFKGKRGNFTKNSLSSINEIGRFCTATTENMSENEKKLYLCIVFESQKQQPESL